MKILTTLLSVLFSLLGYAQQKNEIPVTEWKPLFYLDSVKIDMSELHFDIQKIADVKVVNNYSDSSKHVHGKIFMTSKDPKSYRFLTISDITRTYQKDTEAVTIFTVDNTILKNIESFRIDSSYILKVELTKASEINYLKNTVPRVAIINI